MITPEELAAGAAAAPLLAADAQVDEPMLVVDLDARPAEGAIAAALASDRLLVGLCRGAMTPAAAALAEALDTTVGAEGENRTVVAAPDPVSAIAELREAITHNAHAALVLGQVLKISANLPAPAAIDVESFAYSTLLGAPEFARWLVARGPRPLPPPAPQEPVLIRREGNGLVITLNRPERRNAYGAEVRDGLVAALGLVAADDTIESVVLDGTGPSFSAGGDLDEFGTTPDLATAHLIRTRAGAGRLVARFADRIEAHVHGSCVGAGIEVPAFAGRIVAHPGTVFRLPEVSMGLIPGAGGTVSVPRRIGRWRAFWLGATGVALDAQTALDWGLVDELTD
ncbi:enoyl-CoA hydratase/isomerase family protein [Tomitella biformata]|uniref:enoyl-CoA hydratase/isomerase family protein n=1 Tax=Tomitella biformata TaxID=630403 RepID=UPI000465400D|nr:enoyl-CoA hydratase/isomerase family protein [Tomitella biformata]